MKYDTKFYDIINIFRIYVGIVIMYVDIVIM